MYKFDFRIKNFKHSFGLQLSYSFFSFFYFLDAVSQSVLNFNEYNERVASRQIRSWVTDLDWSLK